MAVIILWFSVICQDWQDSFFLIKKNCCGLVSNCLAQQQQHRRIDAG